MPMTEEQACEKWCPMSRTFHINNEGPPLGPFNRFLIEEQPTKIHKEVRNKCIASDCMMWRGFPDCAPGEYINLIKQRRADTGCTLKDAKEYVDNMHRPGGRGYCGLAGSCHD